MSKMAEAQAELEDSQPWRIVGLTSYRTMAMHQDGTTDTQSAIVSVLRILAPCKMGEVICQTGDWVARWSYPSLKADVYEILGDDDVERAQQDIYVFIDLLYATRDIYYHQRD